MQFQKGVALTNVIPYLTLFATIKHCKVYEFAQKWVNAECIELTSYQGVNMSHFDLLGGLMSCFKK